MEGRNRDPDDMTQADGFDPFTMAAMTYLAVNAPDATHAAIRATGLVAGYYDLDQPALRERWAAGDSLAPDNNLIRIGARIRH